MIKIFLHVLCIMIIFFSSCRINNNDDKLINFYYWKQNFHLNEAQESLLENNRSNKIYCKYFDVVSEKKKTIPISKIQFDTVPSLSIVPCIFIKNNVFLLDNLNKLPDQVLNLINQINQKHNIQINEIQFDCDWTSKTRENYFHFLNQIKQKLGKNISVTSTIRLHQYKYYNETGIPPVDKVVLMCYNMGDITDVNEENSILSLNILKQYVKKEFNYPVDIDIALPIYKWGLIYRLNELAFIINNIDEENIFNFKWKKMKKNFFKSYDNFYFENHYVYLDDILRIERSNHNEISKSISYIKKEGIDFNELILYHLSQNQIEEYTNEFFENLHNLINN